jgi:hypothetical protein
MTLLLTALSLVACGGTSETTTTAYPAAADSAAYPAPGGSAEGCGAPGDGQVLYTNESHGYCLFVPDTHQTFEPTDTATVFAVGSVQDVSIPRVAVNVTDAAGEDTLAAADRIEMEFGMPDMTTRSNVLLNGEEAVVLDNLPGQDTNRRVIIVHNGRLYDLMFSPVGEDYGELAQRTDQVYQSVVDSFRFLP